MNIAALQYSLLHNALEIYVAGCDGACLGCHNPELRDFNLGRYYRDYFDLIRHHFETARSMIDQVWILGGEPLLQNKADLLDLLAFLRSQRSFDVPVILFTRFELPQVDETVKRLCDYIKTGRYEPALAIEDYTMYGIKLATSNQKVVKIQ